MIHWRPHGRNQKATPTLLGKRLLMLGVGKDLYYTLGPRSLIRGDDPCVWHVCCMQRAIGVCWGCWNLHAPVSTQYHPLCFRALLLSRDHCAKHGCNMVILEVEKSWVGGDRVVKSKYQILLIICLPPVNVRLFVRMLFGSFFTEEDDATVAWPDGRNGQAGKDGPIATKSAVSHVWEEGEDTMKIKDVL